MSDINDLDRGLQHLSTMYVSVPDALIRPTLDSQHLVLSRGLLSATNSVYF